MSVDIYQAVFDVASALEVPVVIAALASLAFVVIEAGACARELFGRRGRRRGGAGVEALTAAAVSARTALTAGDRPAATAALATTSYSAAMDDTVAAFVEQSSVSDGGRDAVFAKQLAEFDFGRQRRLGRTRILVRMGPALGLMGTLIPLTPALDGLARGNVTALTDNLRIAFSVTVLGIFVGAVAFLISLVRERIYGQDFSDLEYLAAVLTDPAPVTS